MSKSTTNERSASPYDEVGKRTTGHHPKLGWMIAGGTIAVLVVLGGLAFLLTRGDDSKGGSDAKGANAAKNANQETASVTISGEDLPSFPDQGGVPAAGSDDAVGMTVPKLAGQSFDGSEVTIDPSDGRPKMVVFGAHWCPHCQKEFPLIQDWIASGKAPDGVDIYAVSTGVSDQKPNYPPSKWLAGIGWQPPVMLDDDAQSAAQSWGLTGYPYFVMVDKDGKVWQRGSGEIPVDQIETLANQLAKGEAPSATGSTDDGSTKVSIPTTVAGG